MKYKHYLDIGGARYLLEQVAEMINKIEVGGGDLSNYVKKTELQAELDKLDIDIDLSDYVTKEELTQALRNVQVDLSAYYNKEEKVKKNT